MQQRVVGRKNLWIEALRFGEDWYAQFVAAPWPKEEVDEHTCERGP